MPSENTKRIARNTGALYVRMLLTMLIGLYTSRVVLNTLGVEDYGIYNVVGGVVALFGFLNASMSSATARFLTFELGTGDTVKLGKTFSMALLIHIGIALVIFLAAETVGLWFLNAKLVIPPDRMVAANWVYQCSVLAAMVSVTQVPYDASIIAHERMAVYAYVEILNASLKLLIVFLLPLVLFDKLIFYALLVLAVSILIACIYRFYCVRRFEECRFQWAYDKAILRPMLSFSGWDLYGNMSVMARTQGVNVLLNLFFGAVANAAAGIATQVQGAVGAFVTNIVMAVRPQIVKSYATGDTKYMIELIYSSARFMFLLLLLLSLPILIDTHFVLSVWLKTVPQYAVTFCQLTLLFNFFANLSTIVVAGVHATGHIKRPSFINGSLYLSVIPLTYLAFKFGAQPYVPFACNVLFVFIGSLINLYTLKLFVREVTIKRFLFQVIGPCIGVSILSALVPLSIKFLFEEGWLRFLMIGATSFLSTVVFSCILVLTKQERLLVLNAMQSRLKWRN